ncbi:hypothetical protein KJZ63_04190 [Patescibacteria group bacterium]|nr:hypothetical protein [Patescibacteria group bacterium]
MAKIINNNPDAAPSESATNFLLGLSIIVLVILALWFFGRPYLGGARTTVPSQNEETMSPEVQDMSSPSPATQQESNTNINIPDEIDVNVNDDDENNNQATMQLSPRMSPQPE